jgi:hypothetical protein
MTSTKIQINLKSQYSIKERTIKRKTDIYFEFICYLFFEICYLSFGSLIQNFLICGM